MEKVEEIKIQAKLPVFLGRETLIELELPKTEANKILKILPSHDFRPRPYTTEEIAGDLTWFGFFIMVAPYPERDSIEIKIEGTTVDQKVKLRGVRHLGVEG